jgi:hypothetical protein
LQFDLQKSSSSKLICTVLEFSPAVGKSKYLMRLALQTDTLLLDMIRKSDSQTCALSLRFSAIRGVIFVRKLNFTASPLTDGIQP